MRTWFEYLIDGAAMVGEFGCITIGLLGAFFGGAAIWHSHGWLAVPAALAWLILWIGAASFISDVTT